MQTGEKRFMPMTLPASSRGPAGAGRLAPRNWRRSPDLRPALRVGVGLAIPGTTLLLVGRADLMIYAVFGSVTGMYGRSPHRGQRLRDQLLAGGMLLGAGFGGILAAPLGLRNWSLVLVSVGCAVASLVIADRFALRPHGAFFPLFAFGALATLPGHEQPDLAGLAAYALAVLVSLLLGQLGRCSGQQAPVPIPTWTYTARHASSYGLVVLLAGAAGILFGFEHLQWVLAGAVVPLAAGNARGRVRRAAHRVAGTVAGLGVLLVLFELHLNQTALGIVVILLMFPTEAYMTRNYGLALSFFTPLIMLMLDLAAPGTSSQQLWERAGGNLLGVTAGLVGSWIVDPRRRVLETAS